MLCKIKYEQTCRVCLGAEGNITSSIFDIYNPCPRNTTSSKKLLIVDYINSVTGIEIKKGDGMPDKICLSCFNNFERAVDFKLMCQNSDDLLHRLDLNLNVENFINQIKEEPKSSIVDVDMYSNVPGLHLPDFVPCFEEKLDSSVHSSKISNTTVECHDCGSKFKSKCKLRVHWKKDHTPQHLTCEMCKRVFKTYNAFNKHKKHKLKTCSLLSSGAIHIKGSGKSRVFHCKDCNYKTLRTKDIGAHIVVHSGEKPFSCNLCSASFTQLCSLDSHKEMKHNIYKVETTCQFCGKFIKGRSRIYVHLKQHADNRVQCDICKKFFKTKQILRVHMARHVGVKNFTCEKCACTFYSSAVLCNHKRMKHSNSLKRHFQCSQCDYKATRKSILKRHEMKHRPDNIPCTICGLFVENVQKLNSHQNIHFDEKKYECPHCKRMFLRKHSRNNHIRSKHNIYVLSKNNTVSKPEIVKMDMINIKTEIPIS